MIRSNPLLAGLCLLLVIVAGCSKAERGTGKIQIVVTILPLQEFAEKIGGDKVSVSAMVPPGASPHTHEPTPRQLVNVSKAKMYVKVGSPVEFELVWLDKILSANRNMLVVDASEGITLMKMEHENEHDQNDSEDHKHRGYDPHIWLSPKNAGIMVENIFKGLISIDSRNKDYYMSNRESYIKELSILDRDIEHVLSGKANRRFMVYHPAWGYFAKTYNLKQITIEEEGKEPTARGIRNLIDQAKGHSTKIIFASPQFSTESAEVIAREIQGRVVLISPLEKDYTANLRKVSEALSKAME